MFIDMKILLWWGFYVIFPSIGTNSSSHCKAVQIGLGFSLRLGPFYQLFPLPNKAGAPGRHTFPLAGQNATGGRFAVPAAFAAAEQL